MSFLLMSPALAQVNGPGPSPSNLFDIVFNLPGDEAVGGIGGISGQTTQLNVTDDGTVGDRFNARNGSEVNISGGSVGGFFNALSGSEVNISGGSVSGRFTASGVVNISGGTLDNSFRVDGAQAEVRISGGTIGRFFQQGTNANLELIGGEFRLNGADFSGSSITIGEGDLLTGTLADGSTFIFRESLESSPFVDALRTVTLTAATLPALDLSPVVVNTPEVRGPSGVRSGQTLTVQAGGSLRDSFSVVGGTLNIDGGAVGEYAEASNCVVNVSGGELGRFFSAYEGSEINISGGTVGTNFQAFLDSVVNVSGGTVGAIRANVGSEVNMSGGDASFYDAQRGSLIDITGGTVGDINARGGEVNISGGTVSGLLETSTLSTVVNISGVAVVNELEARFNSQVNISGGSVGANTSIAPSSEVNISGGTVGSEFSAHGEVNISGGTIGTSFNARPFSVVNISGGTFGDGFSTTCRSAVNIFGSEFSIDGQEMDTLVPGEAFTIDDRDVTLSGVLSDGEPFSFNLNSSTPSFGESFFSPLGTVTVTLVSSVILGDVNQDGVVDFFDIPEFIAALQSGEFNADADIDQNGVVNFDDVPAFIAILVGS